MRIFNIFVACIVIVICNSAVAKEPAVYSVGVVPQFEAKRLYEIWNPILRRLESETGLSFRLRGSPSIAQFEQEFVGAKFDFAYMNPYHMIVANDKAGYIPLVRDRGRQLYGVLVVKKGSRIKSPADLQGKLVAFPSPNALGASLQMRQELHDEFNVNVVPRYVKTHDSVYLNVLLGETEAGGGVQKTLNKQPQRYRDALDVIHTTAKVAPHPFAALPSVPAEHRQAVTDALLRMGADEEGRQLLAKIPMVKVGNASMADYAPLRDMGLERFTGIAE